MRLRLIGGYEANGRGQVRVTIEVDGNRSTLREKSFKYLLALAVARVSTASGRIAKAEIEPGGNQNKYAYQLRKELRACGGDAGWIVNDGRGNYMLTLEPEMIGFDLPTLLASDDFEVRRLAEVASERRSACRCEKARV